MLSKLRKANLSKGLPLILLFLIAGFSRSCENAEGIGGTASISGTLVESFYNDDWSILLYQQAAVDEEVFILFGEEESPGSRVRTGHSGAFKIPYLYPGIYSVYFRSMDSTELPDNGWREPIQVEVESGESLDLGELSVLSTLEFDEGNGSISGVVEKIKYADGSFWPNLVIEYVDAAREHEVYLTYGDHPFYDERIRTQDDGSFVFRNLIPGNYRIFMYSEDVTRNAEFLVIEKQTTLTGMGENVDLGEFTIEEL